MQEKPKIRSIGTHMDPGGTAYTVYTCPANHIAKMILLFVSNSGSGNKTVTVEWNDTSEGETYHILGGYVLSAYGYLKLDQSYLVLHPGDTIEITPEASSHMDAIVTVEEHLTTSLLF